MQLEVIELTEQRLFFKSSPRMQVVKVREIVTTLGIHAPAVLRPPAYFQDALARTT